MESHPPLDLEMHARARERDYSDNPTGWLQRRRGPGLVLIGVAVAAAVLIFLVTR